MFAILLCKVGVNTANYHKDATYDSINRAYLTKSCFLVDTKDEECCCIYLTQDHTPRTLILPNPSLTSINVLDNMIFDHIEDSAPEAPHAVEQQTEALQATKPQNRDPWDLPPLIIKPKKAHEKIFYNEYKLQQKINKLTKNKFKWIKSKLKKMHGYVLDKDEFLALEEAQDKERA